MKKSRSEKDENENIESTQIAYIHGRIEAQIEAFANSLSISAGQLTYRVATLLLNKTNGEILGLENRMPNMPRKTRKHKTVAKMEMAERPHNKTHKITPAGRKKLSQNMKKLWSTKWANKKKSA